MSIRLLTPSCCRSKSQIQALDRTQQGLLMKRKVGTMTQRLQAQWHDRSVSCPQLARRHRYRQEHAAASPSAVHLRDTIEAHVPAQQVLDNYATHKPPKVRASIAISASLFTSRRHRARDSARSTASLPSCRSVASGAASSALSSASRPINRFLEEHNQQPNTGPVIKQACEGNCILHPWPTQKKAHSRVFSTWLLHHGSSARRRQQNGGEIRRVIVLDECHSCPNHR